MSPNDCDPCPRSIQKQAGPPREQFEEMLKTLDLKKGGTKRTGENSPQREVNQIESRRTNVPPTYKRAFEQFTKDLNRQKQSKPAGSAK